MLSKSALAAQRFAFNLSYAFVASTIYWDKDRERFMIDDRLRARILFGITTSLSCANSLFAACRCIQSYWFLGDSAAKFLLQVNCATCLALGTVLHLNTFMLRLEFLDFVNKFVRFEQRLTGIL